MQHESDKHFIQDTEGLKNELMMPVGEIGVTVIAAFFVLLFLWAVPKFAEAGPVLVLLQNHELVGRVLINPAQSPLHLPPRLQAGAAATDG